VTPAAKTSKDGAGRHSDRALIRQSSLTGIAAGASVIAGLLLDISIAARFGAGRATDAFFVSARIPLGLVAIVLVAANQALVPAFRTSLTMRGEAATHRLVSMIVSAVLLAGGAVVLVAWLIAAPLMHVTAPGIPASEAATAASMVPVVFSIVPLIAVSEVMRAYLNARYAFVAPALMNVVLNGLAASVVLLAPLLSHNHDIHVVALAYLLGAGAQVTFMSLMAVRRGLRYRPGLNLRDPALRGIGVLSVRPLAGAGLYPVARLGEQLIVSFLPPGSITILNYGYRLISAIGGTIFFRSVIVALVPRLTEAHTGGDQRDVLRITGLGLRIMLAISLPLTPFIAILARPAAMAVFQRGSFTRTSAELLGAVLAVYSISLVGSAVQRALLAPFFARLDTRTPFRNTVYGVIANLALLVPLTLPFGRGNGNAILGVALAFSLSQYVNVGHAWYRVVQSVGSPSTGLGRLTPRLVAASVLSGAAMIGATILLRIDDTTGRGALLLRTSLIGCCGTAVLVVALIALTGNDLTSSWRLLRGRRATTLP
jgi:putative peptidoglycan lipid II flippase